MTQTLVSHQRRQRYHYQTVDLFQVRKNPSDRKGVFLSETDWNYARFFAVFFAAGFLATTFFFGAAFFTVFLTVFFAAAFFFAAIKIFYYVYVW